MARMPDIEAEIKRDWRAAEDRMRHLMHHGAPQPAAPQPAAQPTPPALPHNGTQEDHMSFIDEAEVHAKAILDVFGQADREALRLMEALKANPGAVALVQAAESYLHLPPQAFDVAIGSLATVAKLYPGDTPQQPPAGPVVAGQA